jgi:hypothetical protein
VPRDLSWTPDGKLLYAAWTGEAEDIWRMEVETSEKHRLTANNRRRSRRRAAVRLFSSPRAQAPLRSLPLATTTQPCDLLRGTSDFWLREPENTGFPLNTPQFANISNPPLTPRSRVLGFS